MKMKKRIAIALASVMALGLMGCSSGDSGSGATADGKQKVVAWAWDTYFNVAALKEAEKIFEANNPDIDIEIIEYAQADIIQKLNTGLSSGSMSGMPDIVLIEDYRIQTFLKSYPNTFTDLSSITDDSLFAPHKLEVMTEGDMIYGVPFDNSCAVLYYRRDLMEQIGYTEADMQDLTWDEYIEMGVKLKAETGIDLLALDPNDIAQIRIMMQSAGSWYMKEDGITPNFEGNQALAAGMQVYLDMLDAGITKSISEWSQFVGTANSGEVASVPTGCWFTPSIAQAEDQSGLWGIAPIPSLAGVSGATNASNLGGSSFYVLDKGNSATESAIDFLGDTFASNSDFYQTILNTNNILATYTPAHSGESYTQAVEFFGDQKIYADISEWTKEIPSINYGLHTYAFDDIIKAELQNCINGRSIDDALKSAQSQAEAQIK